MEMDKKFFDRSVAVCSRDANIFPLSDEMWTNCISTEEARGNLAGAREFCEKCTASSEALKTYKSWRSQQETWLCYVNFECKHEEVGRARAIFNRYVKLHCDVSVWLLYEQFEMENSEVDKCRALYEKSILHVSFTEFEERSNEIECARFIYEYSLKTLPEDKIEHLNRKYFLFKNKHKEAFDDIRVDEKRLQFEVQIKKNPSNYDLWFDYIKLEESSGNMDTIRSVYERAIANMPLVHEKHL